MASRRLQGGRLWVLQRELLRFTRHWQAGCRRVHAAPHWMSVGAAVHQAQAVFAHGDLPLQQAIRRGAAGDDGAALMSCAARQ